MATFTEQKLLNAQVGGDHYTQMVIQPWEYISKNGLGYAEGNVVKYVSRWRNKNGIEDLKKARQYIDMLIAFEEENNKTPPSSPIINDDGTVTDTRTNLMWKHNHEEGLFTFEEAVTKFKNVSFAGYSDWRLPTIDELKTLFSIDNSVFFNAFSAFWSSSVRSTDYTWSVDFSDGYVYYYNRSNSFAVRLVRASQ